MKKIVILLACLYSVAIVNAEDWEKVSIKPGSQTLNDILDVDGDIVVSFGNFGLIKRSSDSGYSWETIRGSSKNNNLNAVSLSGSDLFAVGDRGEMIKSTDYGLRWEYVDISVDNDLADIEFKDNIGVVVGDNGLILISSDGGLNWEISESLINDNLNGVCLSDNNYLLAYGDNGSCLHSFDSGKNWTLINLGTSNKLTCHTSSDSLIIIGGAGRTLIKSTDYFNSFEYDEKDLLFDYYSSLLYIKNDILIAGGTFNGSNGQAWSDDGGKSWYISKFFDVPFLSYSFYSNHLVSCGYYGRISNLDITDGIEKDFFLLGDMVESGDKPYEFWAVRGYEMEKIVANEDKNVYLSLDSGMTWKNIIELDLNKVVDIKIPSSEKFIAFIDSSKFVTENGKSFMKHWAVIKISENDGNTWRDYKSDKEFYIINASTRDNYFAVFAPKNILISSDAGNNWDIKDIPDNITIKFGMVISPGVIYAIVWDGTKYIFVRTDNEFADYQVINNNIEAAVNFDLEFFDDSNGWIMIGNVNNTEANKIYKTNDGGKTWVENMSPQLPQSVGLNNMDFVNPQYGYCACNFGYVYFTSDSGTTWIERPVKNAGEKPKVNIYYPNINYAFYADGYGIWRYHDDINVSVLDNTDFSLRMFIFPNPAANSITIQPGNDLNDLAEISITDMEGNSVLSKTEYIITGDEIKLDISMLPAGAYVVSVSSGGNTLNGKFVKE